MPEDAREAAEKLLGLFPPITHVHCKCRNCTLHFKVYTWYPDRWKERNPICPECGNQELVMKLRFVNTGKGFIDFS